MDFSDHIQPLIEADSKGNISFRLVRGGSLVLTDKNTYIVIENIVGELESFEKIDNDEINSLKVEKETDLSDLVNSKIGREAFEKYKQNKKEDYESINDLIDHIVNETDVNPNLFSKVVNRDKPATRFRINMHKRSPTVYLDIRPSNFVRKFLKSEIYRENYIQDEVENGL
jgi:hypothetical protein